MKKTVQFILSECRRRFFHGNSSSLLSASFTSRSPQLITSAHNFGTFARALPTRYYSFSFSLFRNRFISSRPSSSSQYTRGEGTAMDDDDDDWDVEWEEEEETDPVIGDGGDGGGIVLGDVKWGEHALSLAREALLNFGDDITLFAFKVSPKGYIYVRLDKLTDRYGCPDIEEIEKFNNIYKKRLDEAGETGAIPTDMALEVSSPGAERLLEVPKDLSRFQEMAMWVCYLEESQSPEHLKQPVEKVLVLESIDDDSTRCIFKLADVRENRSELGKGRPLNRKQRDWRLNLPYKSILRIKLYLYIHEPKTLL